MTEAIARACGADLANAHMRKHSRRKWNSDDYRKAAREFNRLWPEIGDVPPSATFGTHLDVKA